MLKQKKNLLFRLNFKNYEIKALCLKALARNLILPLPLRIKAFETLSLLSRSTVNKSKTEGGAYVPLPKIRNICSITGRSRGIIKKFGVSRLVFKQLADSGLLSGVRRAS